jgi:tRNA(fMet)-specific endonuclease VapC
MGKSLVDTDILSEYLRGKNVHVRNRAREYIREHGRLAISAVTIFEVVRGRHQANQLEPAAKFVAWAKTNADVLDFDPVCAERAGEIAGAMLRVGTPLAVADVIIGATAVAHGLALVTGNTKHYERLVTFGLRLENWRDVPT